MRYNSFAVRNTCILCETFNWQDGDIICGRVSMSQQYFIKCHHHKLSGVQKNVISLLCELINLGHNYRVFSDNINFNHSDFLTLVN